MMEDIMSDLTSLLNSIDKSGRGVCVQASTLGSLEALLDFLKSSKIPVSGINIGPVHKKDIMRAASMLEKAKELACILCFDVTVDRDAEKMAEEMGIRLFKGIWLPCLAWYCELKTLQLTSSITCLTRSPRTMLRLRKRSERMLRPKLSGHAGSRRSLLSQSETLSFWVSTFSMELCASERRCVWSRLTR